MKATGHIMFAGGGTGGHLFPGLAVAEALRRCETGWRSSFCGVGRELERKGVRECGFDYSVLPAAPLVASAVGVIRAFLTNSMGYRAARQLVREQRPDVVVGLGGYSSIPLGLAAVRERVPLVLLEQNVMPGRANRLLARWASVICLSFAESA